MNKETVLSHAKQFVQHELGSDASGHDWWHIHRVTNNARTIAHKEGANVFVCELAALLHDIADEKLNKTEESGLIKVETWLQREEVDTQVISQVMEIISTMSFKGGNNKAMTTLEGEVVQDADRLDAIGAVGIARTFAYSGAKGQLMHDPNLPPRESMTKEEYRNGKSTAINHFYEKLFKLESLMNTKTGREIARERHAFMEQFVEQFFDEWESTEKAGD